MIVVVVTMAMMQIGDVRVVVHELAMVMDVRVLT